MITIRPSSDRGSFDLGWLQTQHTFSFGHYHNPRWPAFHALRVINEDRVQPSRGFDTHPHRNMEIISFVLAGQLAHADSISNPAADQGHQLVLRPNEVQRLSAGSGIRHSEFNASASLPVHFLQIWITPDRLDAAPNYEQRFFDPALRTNRLVHFCAPHRRAAALDAIPINQDADLLACILTPSASISHNLAPNRAAWVQVVEGSMTLNNLPLSTGDGAAIEHEALLTLHNHSISDTQFLLFDLR